MVTTAIENQYRHFEKEILGIFAGHYNFEETTLLHLDVNIRKPVYSYVIPEIQPE
jgi:hypothetical protein